jgi:signal transduction histidine kinase
VGSELCIRDRFHWRPAPVPSEGPAAPVALPVRAVSDPTGPAARPLEQRHPTWPRTRFASSTAGRYLSTEATLAHTVESELRRSQKETERLARITAAIADAVTPDQISEAIVDEVAAAIDASSAALWVASGRSASLVRSVGYSDESKRALATLPLDSPSKAPIVDSLTRGEPVFIDSQEELLRAYPDMSSHVTPERSYRIACLPVAAQNVTFGVLGFTFDDAPPLDADARRFLALVAKHGGHALHRLQLLEDDRRARLRADLLYRLAASVIEANRTEDIYEAALDAINQGLHTDRSSVLLFDSDGVVRFKAHRGLSVDYRRAVEGHSPWTRDAVAPEPIFVADVGHDAEWSSQLPVFAREGIRSLGFFPMVSEGKLIGELAFCFETPRELSASEIDLARAIANNVASGVSRLSALNELRATVHYNEIFTGVLGHDLRNPLAAILSSAQLAMRRDTGALAKPLSRILNSGTRMARMIEQLLDFTRVRVGSSIPLIPRHVDLASLAKQALDELDGAHPDCTFHLELVGNTGGVWDADRLAQVLSNLVGNAVEHGVRSDGVRMRIDGASADRVEISIHNGGAIAADVLPRILEPMVGMATGRRRSSGLGLGLFITHEIVEAHGGKIAVRSSEGEGTTFTVSLPRNVAAS